jgi:hypothetical protein
MKSILTFIVLILLPVSLLAMTPLSDEDLSAISGQAGVSIMPNITMNIHFDVLAWGDSDGLGSDNIWGLDTSGGYVGVTDLIIRNLYVGPRTAAYTGLLPLTISVGTGLVRAADETYTRIDLEALQNQLILLNLR